MTVPVSVHVLQEHLTYSAWATRRVLEASSLLTPEELHRDFGTADGSVLGTLVHLFSGDRLWLQRMHGQTQTLPTDAERNLPYLQTAYPALLEQWAEWGAAMASDSPAMELSYHDLKGNPWRQPLWQLLLHVVNHATHHRGQIAGFLRSMGHAPPVLDLTAYYRQT